ncbi:MAG: M24 family metallopeptidase [Patescibacteria group bacterium]|jgi:methionyl aminopeptidase
MKIYHKTIEEIEILRQGGKILADILYKISHQVKSGASTAKLEELALGLISQVGGRPAFKDYDMGDNIFFPSALCVSINDEVVHGASLPDRIIKEGDIVNLDIGMEWPIQTKEEALANKRPFNSYSPGGGFYTDTCITVPAGKISPEAIKLIQASREALNLGISKAIAGNTLNDIGRAIDGFVRKQGFSAVRDLVGHGVGYFAHEDPYVFNYEIGEDDPENITLEPGMVIAIEPMINQGRFNVRVSKNNYTILTADKSLSAHFEHSVAILEKGNLILTNL